ncbi:nucleotidyltransferase domain-containing protein [Cytophagaceae bacterium AH-315-L13]|nr:nucleotidyltransferase domain-containing protein [Cytophagaceae bacterium AH-315-L13]
MKFGLADNDLQIIKEVFSKFPEIKEIIVFGSRAMGNYKNGSDVDIVVKGEHVTSDILSKIQTALNQETTLPYFFDVIHFDEITNIDLLAHIQEHGINL